MQASRLFFLPGASGRTAFWRPVADRLSVPALHTHVSWPGFGGVAPDPDVHGLKDLGARLAANIDQPSALIAQSMGGVIAILAALEKPQLVTHLVLTVTSGGMDLAGLGAEDWRPSYRDELPGLPDWFTAYHQDLTPQLPELKMPTLLLWGDADPISPVKVGERLAALLPHSRLHVVAGGNHDLACTHAAEVAPLIDQHLTRT
jgi:pimeloyl-ACP methyl ester carboxylesterase